jgi:hypothetical protein
MALAARRPVLHSWVLLYISWPQSHRRRLFLEESSLQSHIRDSCSSVA